MGNSGTPEVKCVNGALFVMKFNGSLCKSNNYVCLCNKNVYYEDGVMYLLCGMKGVSILEVSKQIRGKCISHQKSKLWVKYLYSLTAKRWGVYIIQD